MKLLDTGTIVQDENCYACESPSAEPRLIDAWLRPHDGPAAYVPGSDSLPAHYVLPGGPGLGEPDIFEHVGLGAWNEWQLMGGRSPNYDQKLPKKKAVIDRLRDRYGADLPVRVGYGIDPRLGGGHQDIRTALTGLINRDRVRRLVVSYHGVGFSDIMQTHMIRHEIDRVVESLGADVEIVYADPIGRTDEYVRAVVDEVQRELDDLPRAGDVAIHLSGHGLPTDMCGEYDCGADSYHRSSQRLFERVSEAIEGAVRHDGGLGVFHLYGDGATDEDDPDDEVDSQMEALAKRAKKGFEFVGDIPYEFDSDSRDTLIILRQGYERPIPDWDHRFESHFTYKKMRVKLSDASFGAALKTDALFEVIVQAMARVGTRNQHGHH